MEVVIDTNAALYATKQKTDVYELLSNQDYTPILLNCVAWELKKLSTDAESGADKAAAKLALQIAEQRAKLVEVGKGDVDNAILTYARENKARILTNDHALKRRARSIGIVTLSVSKNKLMR